MRIPYGYIPPGGEKMYINPCADFVQTIDPYRDYVAMQIAATSMAYDRKKLPHLKLLILLYKLDVRPSL